MIGGLLFATAAAVCAPQAGVSAEQAVDRYIAAYNAHDFDAIRAVYADGVRIHVWTVEDGGATHAFDDVLDGLHDVFKDDPSMQVTFDNRTLLGARLAQVESYSPTGSRALVIYTIVDGCVTARDTYW